MCFKKRFPIKILFRDEIFNIYQIVIIPRELLMQVISNIPLYNILLNYKISIDIQSIIIEYLYWILKDNNITANDIISYISV